MLETLEVRTRRYGPLVVAVLACAAASAPAAEWTLPVDHPRLLLRSEDLPAIRVRCGVPGPDGAAADLPGARFGSERVVLERLRQVCDQIMLDRARADDLIAPAMLHLVTGERGKPDVYTTWLALELVGRSRMRLDIDAIVALDCCWDALPPELRNRVVDAVAGTLEPLDERDTPVDGYGFHRKLCSLAAAMVLHDPARRELGPAVVTRINSVIGAGLSYFAGPMTGFCRERGPVPSSGGNGLREQADLVFACELWRALGGDPAVPLAMSLGKSMEPYLYADTGHPALAHGLIHDDGGTNPPSPSVLPEGFVPAIPWVLARRFEDPVAAWFTRRSLPMALSQVIPEVDRYQWLRLVYGPLEEKDIARDKLPLGRNFGGGWVAMRSGWGDGETLVLFDAGQPFWRSRQHFDAGQFQVLRKGRLAIDSGDDVTHDAIPGRGGLTSIGGRTADWDDYFQATIAHNCVTVGDRSQTMTLYGRPWTATGNQRLIEGNYTPADGPVATTPRNTGELTAFETNADYSYAAADLTAAYPRALVGAMHRSILFVHAGAILVLDRLEATKPLATKTWNLQLPAMPRLLPDGASASIDVTEANQLHGVHEDAGVWLLPDDRPWLQVSHGEGRLFVRTLLPAGAVRRATGGPMKPRTIDAGRMAGKTYFGGDPFGYEHRLWPSSVLQAPNAAYTLGEPLTLGPQFGLGATWGRYDVQPAEFERAVVFLHLLVPADATRDRPPPVAMRQEEGMVTVRVELPGQTAEVMLSLDDGAGLVRLFKPGSDQPFVERELAEEVEGLRRDEFRPR